MLIDHYPKEDIFARVPRMAERIDPVLKELDALLDDDALYQQVRNDFGKRRRHTRVAWAALDPGGSALASVDSQTLVPVELPRDRGAGEPEPDLALVLPCVLGTSPRRHHAHPLGQHLATRNPARSQ